MRLLLVSLLCLALPALPAPAADNYPPDALMVYVGRISSEPTWQKVIVDPFGDNYTDAYLVAGAISHAYSVSRGGGLRTEFQVNVAYNFGAQDHWELNFAPV